MKLRLKEVYSAFANFIYPSHCLHCSLRIRHSLGVFCELCSHQLELLSLVDRCPICFGEDFDKSQEICYTCFLHPPVLKRCAAVFDYTGPAASLIKQMKYGNQPYLARGIGAYLAVQWLKLNWPLPDLIVPVPLTLTHRLSRGYNQSLLIAQSMNLILGSKVKSIIRRSLFDTSQAGLNKRERLHLNAESFSLKGKADVRDQVILIVDDVITTGKTLHSCAEALNEGFPKSIYGLAFCKAPFAPKSTSFYENTATSLSLLES